MKSPTVSGEDNGAGQRRRRLILQVLVAFVAACHSAAGPGAAQAPAAKARSIQELEEDVLHDLAAIDRRVAMRARITPSDDDLQRVAMTAVLRGDDSVA